MLSLYIHIPFCHAKCNYCAFATYPMQEQGDMLDTYLTALYKEAEHYAQFFPDQAIKTIYIWGGTPNLLGKEKLVELIKMLEQHFNCEQLGELSFEFNPYPEEEIYAIIQELQQQFQQKYPRLRFSFGIQSFDSEVLQKSWRLITFPAIVDFLRQLQLIKLDNTVYNLDFIAFGKWNESKKGNRYLWNESALDFFTSLVNSYCIDSFSLYTLELFENQLRKKKNQEKLISWAYFGTDEDIYEEFDILKSIMLDAGYSRYEVSNFALPSKSSIHNRVYREMENYLGLGLNSASFLRKELLTPELLTHFQQKSPAEGLRCKNTTSLEEYCKGNYLDPQAFQPLTHKDYQIEQFFLGLRTDRGVYQISQYKELLIPNYEEKLQSYQEQGFLTYSQDRVVLTDQGMDVYNALLTELLLEI